VGILAFTGLNFMNAPPPVWLALGGVGFVFFSRSVSNGLCFLAIVALGHVSIGGAIFSPYNRIDLKSKSQDEIVLNVNRDFHQIMFNLSDARLVLRTAIALPVWQGGFPCFCERYDMRNC
jgi:hypothetical protein